MRILGIEPGATTGWAVYDTDSRRVVARGLYEGHDTVVLQPSGSVAHVEVMERLVPHGASYPQVVEAAYVAGRIAGELRPAIQVHELTRAEVRRILQDATHTGAVKVRDDKSVRAAVVLLHGGDSATETGGCLHVGFAPELRLSRF